MIRSSNIQLKLEVENRLHIVDDGFTSFCTALGFVHTSSMRPFFFFFSKALSSSIQDWIYSASQPGRSVLTKIAVRSPFSFFSGGKTINHFSIPAVRAFARFRLSCVKQRVWHGLLGLRLRDQRSVLSSAIKLFCDWGQIFSCSSWCFLLLK